jgi:hypothetical protein
VARTGMARFMLLAGKKDYPELHRWSVERREDFWALLWSFAGVRGDPGVASSFGCSRLMVGVELVDRPPHVTRIDQPILVEPVDAEGSGGPHDHVADELQKEEHDKPCRER